MPSRSVTVRSFAKLNLGLRVLHKRSDGFHELRTVFQTISLADTIRIEFEPSRRTELLLDGNVDIPNNLITRAAQAIFDETRKTGRARFQLTKRVPMGAGLGGGSSNAAATLLALPVLAGATVPLHRLAALGTELGSDVPFFLCGGTALGIGRGTELYPLPEGGTYRGLLVAPGIHVSTAEAYGDLRRGPAPDGALTTAGAANDTETFQSFVWALAGDRLNSDWKDLSFNDFEGAVFSRHPELRAVVRKLGNLGAKPALMTGSGSALFGLFDSREQLERAYLSLARSRGEAWGIFRITSLSRRGYQSAWRRQLAVHIKPNTAWPPRSRYSKP